MKDHVSVDPTARPADTLALNIEEPHTLREQFHAEIQVKQD